MASEPNASAYHGIIPPMITPLTDRDTLHEEGTIRLIEHLISGGVNGLFILGSTGEAPSLSYQLRRDLIELVCRTVNHRVPVLVGITDTAFVESIDLAQFAFEHEADAVVLTTPYYFPAGQTELLQYVRHVIEELPLPLMLYNMPALTKVSFEIDTIKQLAEYEQIIGVKDSSGDLDYFAELAKLKSLRPDWSIFMGPENLLGEAMELGGDGGVCGGANIFPKLFTGCYEAIAAGETERGQQLRSLINDLQQIYDIGKYASRHIKATKCAVSLIGLCDDRLAEPFNHFLEPERLRVQQILDDLSPRLDAVNCR